MAAPPSKRVAEAAAPPPPAGALSDTVEIMPLGAGSEVGRSCILLSYKGKNVLLDCGIHPGLSGIATLPYFDDVDLATVRASHHDALLCVCAAVAGRRRGARGH